MRIGLQVNKFTWPDQPKFISETLKHVAQTADEAGFYSLWVMDHFFQIGYIGKPEEPMLEAYTTLGFLAGLTKQVKLGTLVTGVMYKKPELLVKEVTTLDVLSKGRAYLGIGTAWNEEESRALGFAFPPPKERFQHLEEVLQIVHQMWRGDETGIHSNSRRLLNSPQPISQPHPPILIGGSGEKKTLRLIAQYGNACNLFARLGIEELQRKLVVLRHHCQDVGRNYDEIEKTVLDQVSDPIDPDEIINRCKELRGLGFNHIIFAIANVETITPLEVFKQEIIPEVSRL